MHTDCELVMHRADPTRSDAKGTEPEWPSDVGRLRSAELPTFLSCKRPETEKDKEDRPERKIGKEQDCLDEALILSCSAERLS